MDPLKCSCPESRRMPSFAVAAACRSRLPVLRRQPQAQRAVGRTPAGSADHLRRLQAALNQVGLRLGASRERVVVVARDLTRSFSSSASRSMGGGSLRPSIAARAPQFAVSEGGRRVAARPHGGS